MSTLIQDIQSEIDAHICTFGATCEKVLSHLKTLRGAANPTLTAMYAECNAGAMFTRQQYLCEYSTLIAHSPVSKTSGLSDVLVIIINLHNQLISCIKAAKCGYRCTHGTYVKLVEARRNAMLVAECDNMACVPLSGEQLKLYRQKHVIARDSLVCETDLKLQTQLDKYVQFFKDFHPFAPLTADQCNDALLRELYAQMHVKCNNVAQNLQRFFERLHFTLMTPNDFDLFCRRHIDTLIDARSQLNRVVNNTERAYRCIEDNVKGSVDYHQSGINRINLDAQRSQKIYEGRCHSIACNIKNLENFMMRLPPANTQKRESCQQRIHKWQAMLAEMQTQTNPREPHTPDALARIAELQAKIDLLTKFQATLSSNSMFLNTFGYVECH
jgi:hypothetical protein